MHPSSEAGSTSRRGKGQEGVAVTPSKTATPLPGAAKVGGKTHSHNSTFSNTQGQLLHSLLFTALLRIHSFPQNLSPEKHKYTHNFAFHFRGVHRPIMFPPTHSQPVDPRFKPCPTVRQTEKDHGVVSLLNPLSMSSLATNHVPGPSWSSRTVVLSLAKRKK